MKSFFKWQHLEKGFDRSDQLKLFIWYGIIFEIMNNFHRPFAIKFLERIGGDEWMMSLFNSLPGLITLFAVIPGAILIRKHSDIKQVTRTVILIGRSFLLLIAFIPFINPEWQATAFLILFSLMCFPDSLYTTAYQTFIGKLFNEDERPTAIGLRNQLNVPIIMFMTLVIGKIITSLPQTDSQRIMIYQIFYILAFLFGLFEYKIFNRFKVEKNETMETLHFIDSLKHVVKDRAFLFFMCCSLAFHFGWQMGWPLFNIYTIKDLAADEMWLAALSIASSVTMYVGYGYWGNRIRKNGNASVLAINALGMAITPVLYVLSTNLYVLMITSFVSGWFVSGTVSVLFTSLLEVTPEDDRVTYLAVYNTLTNVTLAVSPLVSHFFLSHYGIINALFVTAGFRMLGSAFLFYRSYKVSRSH